jgi:hypothetical protein
MPLIETVTVGNELLGADAVGACGVGAVGDAMFDDEPQAAAEVMSAASERRIRVRFILWRGQAPCRARAARFTGNFERCRSTAETTRVTDYAEGERHAR